MHNKLLRRCGALAALTLIATTVDAGPWAEPGDLRLRHDLLLLADAGLLAAPLTTWPLALGDIAASLRPPESGAAHPPAVADALARVRARLRRESQRGVDAGVRISAAHEPIALRGFQDAPRAEGEITGKLGWTGRRFAWQLEASAVANPEPDTDTQDLRLDGSYAGVALGNWTLMASVMPSWWGPGWDGSLILGAAARPVPALVLRRNQSTPFQTPWLSWLGPWTLVTFAGQLEDERYIPDAKLLGARFAFRPTPDLEIGLARTAQWGGEGRPQDFDSLVDLALGNDNRGDDGIDVGNEPGNQLAGLDFRWQSPLIGDFPYAVYGQAIGEDEAGGTPSRFIAQLGLESWGMLGGMSYRVYTEVADTTAEFYGDDLYNYAYEHGIYRTGYRYRGLPLGHALDNDSRAVSAGLILVEPAGQLWSLQLLQAELNRDAAGRHSLAPAADAELSRIFLTHRRDIVWGSVELGLGARRWQQNDDSQTDPQGYLQWSLDWH